ncbi:MAG: hypothetical protein Q7R81_07880 [Candidatus Peregrinibacteria bacterium]|nr:hypothetical protein [Candidatus Peregrinibacteria bacterium]
MAETGKTIEQHFAQKSPERTRILHAFLDRTLGANHSVVERLITADQQLQRELQEVQAARQFMLAFGLNLETLRKENVSMAGGGLYTGTGISDKPHPDNFAAHLSLVNTLTRAGGFPQERVQFLGGKGIDRERLRGNMFVLGGGNSTPEMKVLFELEGEGEEVRRAADATIPLAYCGVSDKRIVEERGPQEGQAVIVSRYLQGKEDPIAGYNWPVENLSTGKMLWPRASATDSLAVKRPGDEHTRLYPTFNTDGLIVTKMPNFLDPSFAQKMEESPDKWPYVVAFEGLHGIATRGVGVLSSLQGMQALVKLYEMRRGHEDAQAFQAIFELTGIERNAQGFHEATGVQFREGAPLSSDPVVYAKAFTKAQERLQLEQ